MRDYFFLIAISIYFDTLLHRVIEVWRHTLFSKRFGKQTGCKNVIVSRKRERLAFEYDFFVKSPLSLQRDCIFPTFNTGVIRRTVLWVWSVIKSSVRKIVLLFSASHRLIVVFRDVFRDGQTHSHCRLQEMYQLLGLARVSNEFMGLCIRLSPSFCSKYSYTVSIKRNCSLFSFREMKARANQEGYPIRYQEWIHVLLHTKSIGQKGNIDLEKRTTAGFGSL